MEKHIHGGRDVITVHGRKDGLTPYRSHVRWIVWNITTQSVISEHATQRAAETAFANL